MGPIKFGMAETMGKADRLNTWELVLPNFRFFSSSSLLLLNRRK